MVGSPCTVDANQTACLAHAELENPKSTSPCSAFMASDSPRAPRGEVIRAPEPEPDREVNPESRPEPEPEHERARKLELSVEAAAEAAVDRNSAFCCVANNSERSLGADRAAMAAAEAEVGEAESAGPGVGQRSRVCICSGVRCAYSGCGSTRAAAFSTCCCTIYKTKQRKRLTVCMNVV